MAVLLPNTRLSVRRALQAPRVDPYGYRVTAGHGAPVGDRPGHVEERADGTWRIRLDPSFWPVGQHDLVTEVSTGHEWTVLTSDLLRHSIDPAVDYVRVEALERRSGGTEPPDAPVAANPLP